MIVSPLSEYTWSGDQLVILTCTLLAGEAEQHQNKESAERALKQRQ